MMCIGISFDKLKDESLKQPIDSLLLLIVITSIVSVALSSTFILIGQSLLMFITELLCWVCMVRCQEGCKGDSCEKQLEASLVSKRANASQLQGGPATGQS